MLFVRSNTKTSPGTGTDDKLLLLYLRAEMGLLFTTFTPGVRERVNTAATCERAVLIAVVDGDLLVRRRSLLQKDVGVALPLGTPSSSSA